MKKALILVAVILALFFVSLMLVPEKKADAKPYVAVSSFALYELANTLLGEQVEVKKLVPFGVDMHTYRPSVKVMSELMDAKLFVYNGLGLEPWVKQAYPNAMDMSRFVKLHKAHEHHHEHGAYDPHYWLDITNMIAMTHALKTRLATLFPRYAVQLDANAKAYEKQLLALDQNYRQRLSHCKRRSIVLNHDAFGYLAERYGFKTHALTGLSSDEQVSAKKMAQIADFIKKEQIPVIFYERFVSDKTAVSVAKQSGVKAASLYALANVTPDEAKKGYIALMQENLDKLAEAMQCR